MQAVKSGIKFVTLDFTGAGFRQRIYERVSSGPHMHYQTLCHLSLERFYRKHGLQPPDELRTWTARDVVLQISQIRGHATGSSHSAAAHQFELVDQWGLEEAVAARIAAAVRAAAKKAPPKLLGTTAPAKPAYPGQTEMSLKAHLLSIEETVAGMKQVGARGGPNTPLIPTPMHTHRCHTHSPL